LAGRIVLSIGVGEGENEGLEEDVGLEEVACEELLDLSVWLIQQDWDVQIRF